MYKAVSGPRAGREDYLHSSTYRQASKQMKRESNANQAFVSIGRLELVPTSQYDYAKH